MPNETTQELSSFITDLRDILKQLTPPDEVVIHDFEDKEYKLPTAIPARRQMNLFREIMGLFQLPSFTSTPIPENLTGATAVQLLLRAAFEEEVAELLGRAFKIAHPTLLGDDDPLDLFPMEEILAGIIPYIVRFIQRSGMALMGG